MKPLIYKSADKLKCPVCGRKFIPTYYHLEKNNYKSEINILNLRITNHDKNKGTNIPKELIRKSWITSCPKCHYVLRFAAEISKKRILNGDSSFFHLKEFKENQRWFKYDVESFDKPFDDITTYNEKYLSNVKNEITDALSELKLHRWGNLYKKWVSDFSMDSFKFLIRFCSNFDKYCEELNEWVKTRGMKYKSEALDLSEELKETMIKVEQLRLATINNNYELSRKDEGTIRKAFLKLMFELVYKKLNPLDLGGISSLEFNDEYDKEIFILKVEQFIKNQVESNLGLGNELPNFIGALFRKLSLPPLKLEPRVKSPKMFSRLFKN
jgi:hypothetical protein